MFYLYNKASKCISPFNENLLKANPNRIKIDDEEKALLEKGGTLDDLMALKHKKKSIAMFGEQQKAAAKLAEEDKKLAEVSDDLSFTINISQQDAIRIEKSKKKAEAEAKTKAPAEPVSIKYDFRPSDVDDVSDEDLNAFAKRSAGITFTEPPEGLDADGVKMFYEAMRSEIKAKIKTLAKKNRSNRN